MVQKCPRLIHLIQKNPDDFRVSQPVPVPFSFNFRVSDSLLEVHLADLLKVKLVMKAMAMIQGCACVCVVIGCFGICACRSHWNGCMTLIIWCSGVVLCVDRCRFASWCCEPHCNGCMMLHGLCFGEEAGARNLVFFRVKWLQATMKRTSSVRRLRLGSVCFFLPQSNGGLKLLWVCLCVRSYRVFWNLCLQIALEWLRQGCLVWRLHA